MQGSLALTRVRAPHADSVTMWLSRVGKCWNIPHHFRWEQNRSVCDRSGSSPWRNARRVPPKLPPKTLPVAAGRPYSHLAVVWFGPSGPSVRSSNPHSPHLSSLQQPLSVNEISSRLPTSQLLRHFTHSKFSEFLHGADGHPPGGKMFYRTDAKDSSDSSTS